ncbi:MAG: glycosyltransferase family 4 protein [Candidatus Hodarchaeales archaeon]|jgi:glycosyltransferase involved in cell wall biosynthesis
MHIGMLSPTFPPMPGGVSYSVYYLAKNLVKKNHKVTVFKRGSYKKPQIHITDGIKVIHIPYLPCYPFHVYVHGIFFNKYFKYFEKELDLLHIHIPLPPQINTHIPTVATVHGLPEIKTRSLNPSNPSAIAELLFSFFVYNVEQNILQNVDKITTVSKETSKELQLHYQYSERDITVIANGVDIDFFSPKEKKNTEINILYAGRLDYKKGLIELIKSAKDITKKFPDANYLIAGTGPLINDLLRLVKNEGLHNRFTFFGHVNQKTLRNLYRESNVFILPSYYEGFPNVILEAMSCGLPTIATNVGGIPEIVQHQKNGLLIPPRNSTAITNALTKILTDESLISDMGKNARYETEKKYSWEHISNKYLKVYSSLLETK